MRVGNYSVLVPEGVERETGHVHLAHGRQYTIQLLNHDYQRACDAELTVDGKPLGGFRLRPGGRAVLERAPHDHGRFTFYAAGTGEAAAAGEAAVAVPDKGLVQVRFVPERRRPDPVHQVKGSVLYARGGVRGQSAGGEARPAEDPTAFGPLRPAGAEEKTCGGITGLSGHSDQQFVTVGSIDRDEAAAVVISLRLVALPDGPRELRPAAQGNPVPAPV